MKGKLYIISTPIGNMEDITLRAIRVLSECNYILAESSERSSKILQRHGITNKLITFNKDNEKNKVSKILKDLENGKVVGMVSDAGTPSISDPAFELIKMSNDNFSIIPVPGPSSLTCALSVSKIPINKFSFYGFLPRKKSELINCLKNIKTNNLPVVVFESKTRLLKLLSIMKEVLGDEIKINIFRELTKVHEEILDSSIYDAIKFYENKKIVGEFTIILDQCGETNDAASKHEAVIKMLSNKFSPSDTSAIVSKLTGINKKVIYKYILSIRQEG
tara:strand:- start:1256 stop:2083 length:828 start_codon:yes stop_codon:yes gene_type:complete